MESRNGRKRKLEGLATIAVLVASIWLGICAVHAQDTKEKQPDKLKGPQKDSKYISATKCESCHNAEHKGDQWGKWKEVKHSSAYETLDSSTAERVAKEQGIEDPQKSPKCLRCHVTAFDVPKEKKTEDFKTELGVQCDSCHGPGAYHTDTQTDILVELEFSEEENPFGSEEDDAYKPLPEGEIIVSPGEETCKECHNEESPTMKEEFNYEEELKEIRHLDPRKKREKKEQK